LGATTASTISRSLGEISSMLAAIASTFCLTSRVACSAAPLAIVAAREPPVPISKNGVICVSPWTTRTCSSGIPNSVAATCASVVS